MTDTKEVQHLKWCDAIVENCIDFNIPNEVFGAAVL